MASVILPELLIAQKALYDPCGLELTAFNVEMESQEYSACTFRLNGKLVIHRTSKITPTKTGQFVTTWKRNDAGVTEPYDFSDDFDGIIITTKNDERMGQFIFSKVVLNDHGIISGNKKAGKRGIRIYPPWDKATSKQAQQTQAWQLQYFVQIEPGKKADSERVKMLLG
jgi:hypothetical protein